LLLAKRERKLTEPKDEKGNHLGGGDTDMRGDSVGESIKRWPDGFEHDVHARRSNHGVDTGRQLHVFDIVRRDA
jgi:hypothetical protein